MSADRITARDCQLLLVDFQQRLMPAIHEGARVVAEAARLAEAARQLGIPVFATEQNAQALGPNVETLRQSAQKTLAKTHFDACEDGLLERMAPAGGIVMAGCEAHVCLLQTALGLLRAGRVVWVVAPACGSRSPDDHALAMQRLRQAGAGIVSTEMVMFEWLHDCRHPAFKDVLALVKAPAR